jgi:hypothetical protein
MTRRLQLVARPLSACVLFTCVLLTGVLSCTMSSAHAQSAEDSSAAVGEIAEISSSHPVEAMLLAEKFDDLEQMANTYRTEKSRVKGGDWKLAIFYHELDRPMRDDADSTAHLEHLRHWMTARPESVTARIALAVSLHRWAWVARGSGTAEKVTPDGWQKFEARSHEADVVLDSCRSLKTVDPEWFTQKFAAGLAEGWDAGTMKDIFDRGIAAEPDYFYLYRDFANYLLPKWYGKPGESAQFAQTSADHLGGAVGDGLYFRIATVLIKHGDGGFPVNQLDWQRIQRGYAAIQQSYGVTHHHMNQLAYIAWKEQDRTVAQAQFAAIGDGYSSSVWRGRKLFDRARDWANGHEQWPTNAVAGSEGQ